MTTPLKPIKPSIFCNLLSTFVLFFSVSALVSSAYVKIGRTVALYIYGISAELNFLVS
jgi:hypothetical protein